MHLIPSNLFFILLISQGSLGKQFDNQNGKRDPKLFVNFMVENAPCNGVGSVTGVCMKSSDCAFQNGKDIGRCANGAGTCCQIIITTSPSPQTVTRVTQPIVTIASNGVANSNSLIEFPKMSDICQIKINFLQTKLANPSSDPLRWGECISDILTFTGSNSFPTQSFTICGDLSGQHVYLSYGQTTESPSDKISITLKTTSATAKYAFNAIQIKCNSQNIVPDNCLQHWTGNTGRIQSFGFPYQLNNQMYQICTRGGASVMGTEWTECANPTSGGKPFFVSGVDLPGTPFAPQQGDLNCGTDFIQLGSMNGQLSSKLCGAGFPKTIVPSNNVLVNVNFDGDEIGFDVVIENVPPSLDCVSIQFPNHECRTVLGGPERACLCTLKVQTTFIIPELDPAEICPTIEGERKYVCAKLDDFTCHCTPRHKSGDDKNTGFCLEYKNV